jgi:hypothetical protein
MMTPQDEIDGLRQVIAAKDAVIAGYRHAIMDIELAVADALKLSTEQEVKDILLKATHA